MSGRCTSCGAWLLPDATHCTSCQAEVGGDGATPAASEDGPSGGDPFDMGAASGAPLPELDSFGPALPAPAPAPPPAPPPAAPPNEPPERTSRPEPAAAPPRADARARVEAMRVAKYGPPPESFFAAIPYSILVFNRRRELRTELLDAERIRDGAARSRQQALARLGRALLDQVDQLDASQLGPALQNAVDATARADETNQSTSRAHADLEAEMQQYAAQIETSRAEVGPWRDKETKLATQLNVKENDLNRAQARLQRIEIELRNLSATPDADPSRVSLLDADRSARQGEVDLASAPVRELTDQLADVRRELAGRMATVSQLEEEKRQASQILRSAENTQKVRLSAAQDALDDTLRALADAARQHGVDQSVVPEEAERATRAWDLAADRQCVVELHRLALDAYDRPAVIRGAAVLGAAALIILVMLVLIVVT